MLDILLTASLVVQALAAGMNGARTVVGHRVWEAACAAMRPVAYPKPDLAFTVAYKLLLIGQELLACHPATPQQYDSYVSIVTAMRVIRVFRM